MHSIKGFSIKLHSGTYTIKLYRLVDDTTLFCDSITDVELAMNEMDKFRSFLS